MKREEEDRVLWEEDSKGIFFVRGVYSLLETDYTTPFPLKIIWNSWIPLKVSFFNLGGLLGKRFDIGSTSKKWVEVG